MSFSDNFLSSSSTAEAHDTRRRQQITPVKGCTDIFLNIARRLKNSPSNTLLILPVQPVALYSVIWNLLLRFPSREWRYGLWKLNIYGVPSKFKWKQEMYRYIYVPTGQRLLNAIRHSCVKLGSTGVFRISKFWRNWRVGHVLKRVWLGDYTVNIDCI